MFHLINVILILIGKGMLEHFLGSAQTRCKAGTKPLEHQRFHKPTGPGSGLEQGAELLSLFIGHLKGGIGGDPQAHKSGLIKMGHGLNRMGVHPNTIQKPIILKLFSFTQHHMAEYRVISLKKITGKTLPRSGDTLLIF